MTSTPSGVRHRSPGCGRRSRPWVVSQFDGRCREVAGGSLCYSLHVLKIWLIAGLLLLSPKEAGTAPYHQNDAQKHEGRGKKAPASPAESGPTPAQPCQPAACPSNQGTAPQPQKGFWEIAFGPEYLSNWILAVSALAALGAALKTLGAINQQVGAMVNSDRAWLVVELKPHAVRASNGQWYRIDPEERAVLMSPAEIVKSEHLAHRLRFTNMGQTPAHVLCCEVGYSYVLAGGKESPLKAPEEWPFDHTLAAGKSTVLAIPIINVMHHLKSVEEIRAVNNSQSIVAAHGWVQYKHVFNRDEIITEPFRFIFNAKTQQMERGPRTPEDRIRWYEKHSRQKQREGAPEPN
jgi:hypothetical protein